VTVSVSVNFVQKLLKEQKTIRSALICQMFLDAISIKTKLDRVFYTLKTILHNPLLLRVLIYKHY